MIKTDLSTTRNKPTPAAIISAAYQSLANTIGSNPTVSVPDVYSALGIWNHWQTNRTSQRIRQVLLGAGFTYVYTRGKKARYQAPEVSWKSN